MRLIDADELKEQFLAKCVEECAICKYNNRLNAKGTEYTCGLIDNAPTVELDESVIQEVLNKRSMTAVANEYLVALHGNNARPQGKWIKIFENPFTNGYVCPFCGHKIQVTEQFLSEVTKCEVCGADMRKRSDE